MSLTSLTFAALHLEPEPKLIGKFIYLTRSFLEDMDLMVVCKCHKRETQSNNLQLQAIVPSVAFAGALISFILCPSELVKFSATQASFMHCQLRILSTYVARQIPPHSVYLQFGSNKSSAVPHSSHFCSSKGLIIVHVLPHMPLDHFTLPVDFESCVSIRIDTSIFFYGDSSIPSALDDLSVRPPINGLLPQHGAYFIIAIPSVPAFFSVVQRFQELFSQTKYKEAVKLAAETKFS